VVIIYFSLLILLFLENLLITYPSSPFLLVVIIYMFLGLIVCICGTF
jgi:hypothetical protein